MKNVRSLNFFQPRMECRSDEADVPASALVSSPQLATLMINDIARDVFYSDGKFYDCLSYSNCQSNGQPVEMMEVGQVRRGKDDHEYITLDDVTYSDDGSYGQGAALAGKESAANCDKPEKLYVSWDFRAMQPRSGLFLGCKPENIVNVKNASGQYDYSFLALTGLLMVLGDGSDKMVLH